MLQIKATIIVDIVAIAEMPHRHVLDEISGVITTHVPI